MKVDDKKARKKMENLTQAEETKYENFVQLIEAGNHPKNAADELGDSKYTALQNGVFEIRLSQKNRVFFQIDGDVVTILQIGGHTR